MKIIPITDLNEQLNTGPLSLALGNFDGVHRGHIALLETARNTRLCPAVFTFGDKEKDVITPLDEKAKQFATHGIELVFCAPFSLFQPLSPEEFLAYLKDKLAAKHLVCGYNFRFGKGASGNADTLKALAAQNSIDATVVAQVTHQGITVSASEIRRALREGNIPKAEALLGRPYTVSGTVVRGYGIGRTLSFPTLNLDRMQTLLPYGVYITEVTIEDQRYPAITNLGKNPTFARESTTCESHLLDAEGDFYEKQACVRFFSYLRDERAFSSPEALRAQVLSDIAAAKVYHERRCTND